MSKLLEWANEYGNQVAREMAQEYETESRMLAAALKADWEAIPADMRSKVLELIESGENERALEIVRLKLSDPVRGLLWSYPADRRIQTILAQMRSPTRECEDLSCAEPLNIPLRPIKTVATTFVRVDSLKPLPMPE